MQSDVVRHVGMTDGAEQHGVMAPQDFPSVSRHDTPGLLVVGAAPGELIPFDRGVVVP